MVLFYNVASQEMCGARPREEVAVYRPMLRRSFACINPILSNPGGKNRVLDVEEEVPTLLQRAIYLSEHRLQVRNVVQGQIGDHAVPPALRALVVLDSADAVFDGFLCAAPLGLLNHPPAPVQPQHPGRPLLRRKAAVPAIAAPQIQNRFSPEGRK